MSYEAWGEPEDSPFDAASEAGWINPDDASKAMIDVMNERDRQQDQEGWTHEHDDEHKRGELAGAASSYALAAMLGSEARLINSKATDEHYQYAVRPFAMWPKDWPWKPKNPRHDLVRAAALIIAEIERLDRAARREVE